MLIILDTNVLYQALRNKDGASNYILNLVIERKIDIALSVPVFNEYEEVLLRKETLEYLKLNSEDIDNLLDLLSYLGKTFNTYFLWRPNSRDEKNNMFVKLAVA
jgi:putative PIN family toxin of toxin-antitoxin system